MSNHDDPAMPVEGYTCDASGALAGTFVKSAGLTKREYAAIHLRVPDSGDEVIDAMIRKAQRRDVAVAIYTTDDQRWCAVNADSVIAELEKQP